MLDFMRRNARSWGIRAALGLICLVFIFFMGGGGRIGSGPRALVKVGDLEVSAGEFEMAKRRNENYFRQQFEGQAGEELLKQMNIPRMTLDQLVDGAVLRIEAARLGLQVTEDAIREQLMRVPSFQSNGGFSPALYRETLRAQGLSPGTFEESVRDDLLEAQISDIVRRGAHVGEAEAWEQWQRTNRRMALSWVELDSKAWQKDVATSDEAVTRFYETRGEDYRRPATVKVRFAAYKVADIAAKIPVSDVDLNEYYELNRNSEFQQQEEVAARHILKRVEKDAGDDERKAARAALEAVAAKVAAGEDFAKLAEKESEDPGSAAKGGDLGFFSRGRMVPEFDAAAFALDKGKVSGVVETPFGFHLIQVYDRKEAGTLSFDAVKDRIQTTLAMQKAVDAAFDQCAEDAARIDDGQTLDAVAGARGMVVGETAAFAQGDVVPGLGSAPALSEAAFALANPGDASQPVKVGSDWYLVSLVSRTESAVPPLSEIRASVEADYKAQQAVELARKHADELLASLKSGSSLADVAAKENLEVKKAADIGGASTFVKGLGVVAGLSDVAFATTRDGEPLSRSFVSGDKVALFVRDSVKEASREDFAAKRDQEIDRLEKARQQEGLREFLRQAKTRLKIEYDQDQLRALMGDSAPAEG